MFLIKRHNQRTEEKSLDKKNKKLNTKRDSAQRDGKKTHSSGLTHQIDVPGSTYAQNLLRSRPTIFAKSSSSLSNSLF